MLLKDDKKGLVTIIMKRMKGGDNNMSPSFSSDERSEEMTMEDGAEQDNEVALNSCAEDMMNAIKSGNTQKLKTSLKSFMEMIREESEY